MRCPRARDTGGVRPASPDAPGLDALLDTRQALLRTGRRIDAAAAAGPSRRVTVLGVYGAGGNGPMAAAVGEIRRSRHEVTVALGSWPNPLRFWRRSRR